MPVVVLRHPKLPGQPAIVDVPVGSYIPDIYRGWEVDSKTDPTDAQTELEATRAAAAAKAAEAAAAFKPEFAPLDEATPNQPAEPVNLEPASAPLDLSQNQEK